MAFINALLACLELLPNFHDENLAAFHLIFVAEIWQHFISSASLHTKHYPYQAFDVRIWQKDALFSWRKSDKVLCLVCYGALTGFRACIYSVLRHVHTKASRSSPKHQTR